MQGSERRSGQAAEGFRPAVMLRSARARRYTVVVGVVLVCAAAPRMTGDFSRAAPRERGVANRAEAGEQTSGDWGALELLQRSIPAGQARKMSFALMETFAGSFLDTPLLVVRGSRVSPYPRENSWA